jgi:hypothetical protein
MDLLPDLKAGSFEIRDLLGIGMTALGSLLAFLSTRLGKRQVEIAAFQKEVLQQQLYASAAAEVMFRRRDGQPLYTAALDNRSSLAVRGFSWQLIIDDERA